MEACNFCFNSKTDLSGELNENNDFSSISIGSTPSSYRMAINSGDGKPTNIDVMTWSDTYKQNICVCYYVPKYCPECGRYLFENEKQRGIRRKINENKNRT